MEKLPQLQKLVGTCVWGQWRRQYLVVKLPANAGAYGRVG